MTVERETGWWWAKVFYDWSVVYVDGSAPVSDGFWVHDIDSPDIEWGYYLGKDPGEPEAVNALLDWMRERDMLPVVTVTATQDGIEDLAWTSNRFADMSHGEAAIELEQLRKAREGER